MTLQALYHPHSLEEAVMILPMPLPLIPQIMSLLQAMHTPLTILQPQGLMTRLIMVRVTYLSQSLTTAFQLFLHPHSSEGVIMILPMPLPLIPQVMSLPQAGQPHLTIPQPHWHMTQPSMGDIGMHLSQS